MKEGLRYSNPGDRIFNRVISDISVVQRETTLITSDSFDTGSLVESEIGRMVSHSTTEIKALKTLVWHLSREPMKEISSLKK